VPLALVFPVPAMLVSSSENMDVTGVSGATDSLAEVKGDAIESGVVVADSAAIRFDLRVTLSDI